VKHIELDTRIQCTNDVRACTRELEYNDVRVCTRELDCRHTQTRDRILYNRETDGQTDGQTDSVLASSTEGCKLAIVNSLPKALAWLAG
jgi:hypothetical protein